MAYLNEAGINFSFSDKVQVLIGKVRKPFIRAQLTDDFTYLTPWGYFSYNYISAFVNSPYFGVFDYLLPLSGLNRSDDGVVVHGDLVKGMLRYRVGVFNEDRNFSGKWWLGINVWPYFYSIIEGSRNDKKNFEWNARIEFTPTLLGFKPESAATITGKVADTYLGSKDVLTIGFGYHTETHTPEAQMIIYEDWHIEKKRYKLDPLKRRGWTVDVMVEKRFRDLVPNIQAGYINLKNAYYYNSFQWDGRSWINDSFQIKKGDVTLWYVAGQLLWDRTFLLGKPAIAFKYEKLTGDGEWTNGGELRKNLTVENFGVAFNYYIKGQATKVSLGVVQTKYKDALKYALESGQMRFKDSITDWYLMFQLQF